MEQPVKIVLRYLRDHDCIESFLSLERQSGVRLTNYSKEIEFFKKIMLKGDFNEAVTFLSTFENRVEPSQFKRIMLDVHKQKLYELIENPNEDQLKNLFEKELIHYCSEEEFQELFNYLTYRSVNEIEDLEKWTVLRGRYQCFENVIPYLEMFNSVLKNDEVEERLQDVLAFYNQNKDSLKQPYSFNRKGNVQQVQADTFQKNKSSIPMNVYKPSHNYSSSEESEKKRPLNENNLKQKDIIKNNISNMNISGNYSQMKSKLNSSIDSDHKKMKYGPSQLEDNYSKMETSNLPIDRSVRNVDKSQTLADKIARQAEASQHFGQKDNPSIRDSIAKSTFVDEKRPRANANLSAPMNRERLEGSVKVDNFMKNESNVLKEQNIPSAYKQLKVQKSQMINASGNYSQISNPSKLQRINYSNKLETPLSYAHFNEMESSQLNEIEQEDHSEATKSVKNERHKYSYLNSKREDDDLEDEVRRNIEYLQQTSSVIYNKEELDNEGYTFANREHNRDYRVSKIVKLAATTDPKAIRTCQYSDSGNLFAVGTNSSILKIFDVQGLFNRNKYQEITPVYQIEGLHLKSIFCLHWHSNERSLVTCSNDLHIKLTEISKNFSDHKTTVIGKHESCIRMVKFSPSESKVFSCGDDSTIKAWDLGKVKKCVNLKGHSNSVSAIKLQNQNQLYSVSKDQTIKKWDLRINENVATSQFQESELTYIANNTDDIIVSHKNGTVSFFSRSLQLIHSVQIHEEEIRSIEALKNDNMLLTASFDGHVAFFNEHNSHEPSYFQHNDSGDDKVVFATFLHSADYRGFSSTSAQGLCHIYSYQ